MNNDGLRARRATRWDRDQPMLALLLHRNVLHAGIARGPRPGKPLCEQGAGPDGKVPSMLQHPLFARDPSFAPDLPARLRHSYAGAALELNDGCRECIAQLVATGGAEIYPYLDPVKAVPGGIL